MNPKATLHLTTCPPNLHKGMVMYINYTTKWYDKLCYKHLYTQYVVTDISLQGRTCKCFLENSAQSQKENLTQNLRRHFGSLSQSHFCLCFKVARTSLPLFLWF